MLKSHIEMIYLSANKWLISLTFRKQMSSGPLEIMLVTNYSVIYTLSVWVPGLVAYQPLQVF